MKHDVEVRSRIASLVEHAKDDRSRSSELFQYVWTMMCVRRGLMRIVEDDGERVEVEEVRTGQRRSVPRPEELDTEIEGLAVQALARILAQHRRAG